MTVHKNWQIKSPPDTKAIAELVDQTSYSSYFLNICYQKGLTTPEAISSFISPDETWLHDPLQLYDMERSIDRIEEAVSMNQHITVYGDYDADGVTSTSIVYDVLTSIGAEVTYYIPNRFTDGYGPNVEAFKRLIDNGTQLIITVDNGISGHEAIDYAYNNGVDVIVTDHHDLPDELPKAYSIIHPRHPNGNYPFGDLSGAGVAFKLAHALIGEIPADLCDLVAIGTVADMVKLTDENRALVTFGLQQLKQTTRWGIKCLCQQLDINMNTLDEMDIGFSIAPVLNAVGRLQDATPAVELLTLLDDQKATQLVAQLIELNEERKAIVNQIVQEVKAQLIEPIDDVIILWNDKWHEGVLGIVASRIVKEYGRPVIIMKEKVDQGILKGSARSIEAFHLFDICNQRRELFESFGGHHMAAGMSIARDNIDKLRIYLTEVAKDIKQQKPFQPTLSIDHSLDLEGVSLEMIEEINLLKPFGMGNEKPIHSIDDVSPLYCKQIGVDQSHLKLTVTDSDQQTLDAIGFGFGEMAEYLTPAAKLSLAGTLDINEWNGNRKIQLMVDDMKLTSPRIIDKRKTSLSKDMFQRTHSHYIFFNDTIFQSTQPHIHEQSTAQLVTKENQSITTTYATVILVDCPSSMEMFQTVWHQIHKKEIVLYLYSHQQAYLMGLPTRDEEIMLYKYLYKQQTLPIKQLVEEAARVTKLPPKKIRYLLKMFLKAKFVTITEGTLFMEKNPKTVSLHDTDVYHALVNQINAEEQLIYSSIAELTKNVMKWNKERH